MKSKDLKYEEAVERKLKNLSDKKMFITYYYQYLKLNWITLKAQFGIKKEDDRYDEFLDCFKLFSSAELAYQKFETLLCIKNQKEN